MESDCKEVLMRFLTFVLLAFMALVNNNSSSMASSLDSRQEVQQDVYVVHLGAKTHNLPTSRCIAEHHSLLASTLGSIKAAQDSILYHYQRSFRGFAAKIGPQHVQSLRESRGVVGVFRSKSHTVATTNSWNFLGIPDMDSENAAQLDSKFPSLVNQSNVIIGMLDTGYWPESLSFHDTDLPPVPIRWKGECVPGENFTADLCNNKVIGARYYYKGAEALLGRPGIPGDIMSARDVDGHGSHTASTAAGRSVANASLQGMAAGRARGGAPGARLAIYKVCWKVANCTDADVLAGFDDALADGVDILSVSLASSPQDLFDAIGIGSYYATRQGVLVAASAGNSGPSPSTVANTAPWLLTVAATTTDRKLVTNIKLGDGTTISSGWVINTIQLPSYVPIVVGGRAVASATNSAKASFCDRLSLNRTLVKGAIVVCEYDRHTNSALEVQEAGGLGIILVGRPEPLVSRRFNISAAFLSAEDVALLDAYFNRTETQNPVGLIMHTVTSNGYMPAPVISSFSSRGPSALIPYICKPDIAAPGQDILAAYSPLAVLGTVLKGDWMIMHGTSMACPHVAGIAALVKAAQPFWSPAAIKSAIMTSAHLSDNTFIDSTIRAYPTMKLGGPLDFGSGFVHPAGALDPGLVYEIQYNEYEGALYSIGIRDAQLQTMSGPTLDTSSPRCAQDAPPVETNISNLNYPSITVGGLQIGSPVKVVRTVTSVSSPPGNATYRAAVWPPDDVVVTVEPPVLEFQAVGQQNSYTVTFHLRIPREGADTFPRFGFLEWSDGIHSVGSPLVIL